MPKAVDQIYKNLESSLSLDFQKQRQLLTYISNIVNKIYMDSIGSQDGYCYKFKIPEMEVNSLYSKVGVDQKQLFEAFKKDWGSQVMLNRMHSDSYYQILLLLVYYGLKNKLELLAKNALLLILIKVWNGRKAKYIKYCDPKIMNYVRDVMMSNKFVVKRYDHPFFLIKEYFVDTLLEKYKTKIVSNTPGHLDSLKRLFEQCHSRVRQVFAFDFKTDLRTGNKIAGSGILPLYMKAKEEGLYLGSNKVKSNDNIEGESTFDDFGNIHERDKMVNDIVNYITMNPNPTYPDQWINTISKIYKTNVNKESIRTILTKLHNYIYSDDIRDLIVLILERSGMNDKSKICSGDFFINLRRRIIASKNNKEVNKIYSITNKIVNDILQKSINKKLEDFSYPHQLQIMNVVIYGLYYNIRKKVCKN